MGANAQLRELSSIPCEDDDRSNGYDGNGGDAIAAGVNGGDAALVICSLPTKTKKKRG